MSTLCTCGHQRSQHHVREEGGRRICDYAGYACNCEGYKPESAEKKQPAEVKPLKEKT